MSNREVSIHFIVGMSRAGTNWMMRSLNKHPEIVSFGETLYWGRNYLTPQKDNHYTDEEVELIAKSYEQMNFVPREKGKEGNLAKISIEDWHSSIGSEIRAAKDKTPAGLFKAICAFMSEGEGKSIVVEKTPHHVNWIDRISLNLPDAKFIVMIRDPYDFMLSYKFQGMQRTQKTRALFEKSYHPFLASIIWKGYAKSIHQIVQQKNSNIYLINNRDLSNNPDEIFESIFSFLGASTQQGSFKPIDKSNSSFEGQAKPKLTSLDIFWINLVASREIRNLGNTLQTSGASNLEKVTSVLLMPLWAIKYISTMRGGKNAGFFRYALSWLKK